jgi:acetyl-CoA carboxylase biotin carboxylase subunit
MVEQGLTVLPGRLTADVVDGERVASEIGFPVIIKAVAGGGGRGMRVVRDPDDFAAAYLAASAEAQAVFGNPDVYVERLLEHARHIEVQIVTDSYGNGIHLGARDCSIQRRHQKLIEETPVPHLDAQAAERICAAAVEAAIGVGYRGAGTLEFLLDHDGRAYFMEINCRIQVEHPVTEMATGVDIVRQQLLVASGSTLDLKQDDINPHGVSIECRINAEDPDRDFAPTPGKITSLRQPGGPFTRVDTHISPGYQIPTSYDSLLAKLIVWAPDRSQALARMRRALHEFQVGGDAISTTIPFLMEVIRNEIFASGQHDLGLVAAMIDVMDGSRGAPIGLGADSADSSTSQV